MNGQWIGNYTGTNNGYIIVNIDDRGDHFEGVAYLFEDAPHLKLALPDNKTLIFVTNFLINGKTNPFEFQTQQLEIISDVVRDNIKKIYPNFRISENAQVKGSWDDDELTINWETDIGSVGRSVLPKSKADKPSERIPIIKDWNGYKEYVVSKEKRLLFRGQNKPRRLRTAFHKTGRANLVRFINEDIPTLHKRLSAKTRHIFNLSIPNENGAFLNLIQHHGYPTPLLDWSYSPYVAAFFAYRGITNSEASKAAETEKVRIFVFDQAQWEKDFNQPLDILGPWPYLSIAEFIAIDNERMIPQQAASTVTNIDDIESYIKSKETEGKQYIEVIDLPVKERTKVMRELSYMGITATSLFPGLDGACEELRERFFGI